MKFHCLCRSLACGALGLAATTVSSESAQALIITNYSSISPLGAAIRFDEIPYGTVNPTYQVGPSGNAVAVSFGSHFQGQSLGALANTMLDASPSGPLTLASSSPVATSIDMALGSVALGGRVGSSYFTTPISMRFSQPVSAVGFRTGHFDLPSMILFEAFNAQGASLGIVLNPQRAVSFLGLRSDNNLNEIAGLSIYMRPATMDWEGYTIDDLIISRSTIVEGQDVQSIPEPVGMACVLFGALFARIRHKYYWVS